MMEQFIPDAIGTISRLVSLRKEPVLPSVKGRHLILDIINQSKQQGE